jgi:para-nitrobenzyl esterase
VSLHLGPYRIAVVVFAMLLGTGPRAADPVRTESGFVEGTTSADGKVRIFKGIPFAAPPVGDLRWKAPQPAAQWTGVKRATEFGARCMQGNNLGDAELRDAGPSEDCLYLNVWTPEPSPQAPFPVMVWIYGGGFTAGSASYAGSDGEMLAKKGVVVVSFNYRVGIFGFFAYPGLAKESPHRAAGNYGLLDQVAALEWVQHNIRAFGGDPGKVTIFGESAGSFSVSALMASPLSRELFQGAIGESGSILSKAYSPKPLAEAEADARHFADSIGARSLAALRAKPAADLLAEALKPKAVQSWPDIDGYFFPKDPREIYANGKQSHVPMLAGWNTDEAGYRSFFKEADPTAKNFVARAHQLFGDNAESILKLYPAATDEQAKQSAQDLSGDEFMGYCTWKWIEMQDATGKSAVFRYEFEDAPPMPAGRESHGAYHSAEIEFVFEMLPSERLPWRPEDEKLSDLMSSYWTNFAKRGDPNGPGLPPWPPYSSATRFEVMHLSFHSHSEPDAHRARYEFLDRLLGDK